MIKKFSIRRPLWIVFGIAIFCIWLMFFKMIPPGHIGIIVNMFGDDKGIASKELGVGVHWIAPWKTVYEFPVFEQNHIWDGERSFAFQSGDGMNLTADMGISYHLEPGKVHVLFAKYRRGLEEISDVFIRNYARDSIVKAASKLRVEDLYGTEKQKFIDHVQEELRAELHPLGILIDRVYLIGTLHFPAQVVKALNSKIEATQRAQQRENELREAQAQAQKEIAHAQGEAQKKKLSSEADAAAILIRAHAEAEANRLVAESLSSEIIFYQGIKSWDGKLPQFMGTVPNILMPWKEDERK